MNNTANKNIISLLELQMMIKEELNSAFSANYQVVADINEIKENVSGHCYLELVQHDENSSIPKAKVNATIWAYTYRMLKPYFENETGTPLSVGMKISITVQIQYHQLYGLNLNIIDIDPTYTVSEIQLQRQLTIKKLIDDGIFDMNRSLQIAVLPLRIAVISSSTAAGYRDFINQLYSHDYNFQTTLFAASMQGKDAEASIIAAIDEVYNDVDNFDILVIIRGGGSVSDLSCFDSYLLASHIAQIPIPVITGIGHDKDMSVADMVANTMTKTPTAAAEFLIDCAAQQDFYLNDIAEQLTSIVKIQLQNESYKLHDISIQLKNTASIIIERNKYFIKNFLSQQLKPLITLRFREIKNKLHFYQTNIELNNPKRILQRGYSIVTHNGKVVTDANSVKPHDEVEIILHKGRKTAIIKSYTKQPSKYD
ncbi:MAG: exodeoxyribonuclease VII large subunit [Prevotellaceae bacterium]|jgi:exodeoxyribonuclease VII large subunit|nr:exodeoxyribonuclease VII large subunit [Prevotellaceae bacterium]